MKPPSSVYTHCDELDHLPAKNRENWLKESELIAEGLPKNASVLQIGCANCSRLIDLKTRRPDLTFLGIDIDEKLLSDATEKIAASGLVIERKLCDITSTEQCALLGTFDVVLCLNNTLGYIPDETSAIENMRKLGKEIWISVYAEPFTDNAAREYFETLGLMMTKIENNRFFFDDFSSVKRFTNVEVDSWKGTTRETPLGLLCVLT